MIDYIKESEKYRPDFIKTLLVGEAPPPSGNKYFYVPRAMSSSVPIEKDETLPATIFHHYFKTRPNTVDEYVELLNRLKEMGIFLVDICDENIRVRGNKENKQVIKDSIPRLRHKLLKRDIDIEPERMIFLEPRGGYRRIIKKQFPGAAMSRWKPFRLNSVDFAALKETVSSDLKQLTQVIRGRVELAKSLSKSLPKLIQYGEAHCDYLEYTAQELEHFTSNDETTAININSYKWNSQNLRNAFNYDIPTENDINLSLASLTGFGTSLSTDIVSEVHRLTPIGSGYFRHIPTQFTQLNVTEDLIGVLTTINVKIAQTWESVGQSLTSQNKEAMKNAAVGARTVFDEISWLTDSNHIKTLSWCELDKKEMPIRSVRYAWIYYGDHLPEQFKNNASNDPKWKPFYAAYGVLQKFVHKSDYEESEMVELKSAIQTIESNLLTYLNVGSHRLKPDE